MADSKVLENAVKRRPPNAGKGRVKGVPNKTTAAVKDMILQALNNKGGVEYLERQAEQDPRAFLGLVGKVIPLDVNNNHSGGVRVIHVPVPKTALDE